MRYRLIATDLDGTLLGPDGKVSAANCDAIHRAQEAGVIVVPCTGRAWHESHFAIDGVRGLSVGIFITGASINEVATGRVVRSLTFDPSIAATIFDLLADLPDAVLIFRDRHQSGHDYLVAGRGALPDNTRWWFEFSKARVAYDASPRDLSQCLRIAMVSHGGRLCEAEALIEQRLGHQVNAHRFGGIARDHERGEVEILEVFPAGVDKWAGIRHVAREHGIADHEIAVIGDEINDIPMLRAAGCGIAMGNAIPAARDAADHQTRGNEEDGVAYAIDQMLAGAW